MPGRNSVLANDIAKVMFHSSHLQKNDNIISSLVENHYFNHSMDLHIPAGKVPLEGIRDVFEDSYVYLAKKVPLSQLITQEFIGAFIKAGSLFMISHGTHIDYDDCVALTPRGDLLLNLTRHTYHQLGLDGHVCQFHSRNKDRYVVTLRITDEHFKPGGKFFERVRKAFLGESHLQFDMLMSWDPLDDGISASSLGAYLQRCGYACGECGFEWRQEKISWLTTPVIRHDSTDDTDTGCSPADFHEWLGGIACGIQQRVSGQEQDYVSDFTCPSPSLTTQTLTCCSLTGMLTTRPLTHTLNHLRRLVTMERLPWVAVTVHGFHDAPVTLANKQHGYTFHGDNSYTIVVFPGDSCWIYTTTGKHDVI